MLNTEEYKSTLVAITDEEKVCRILEYEEVLRNLTARPRLNCWGKMKAAGGNVNGDYSEADIESDLSLEEEVTR
ncbi:hypothetical protein SK128_015926, partial [Halocaridina rubra]